MPSHVRVSNGAAFTAGADVRHGAMSRFPRNRRVGWIGTDWSAVGGLLRRTLMSPRRAGLPTGWTPASIAAFAAHRARP